jgi:uncharacterized metal-binding protein YceD (DUF177 family)
MKVHVNQIPTEGKRYEGEDPAIILDLSGTDIAPVLPVSYALDVGLSDGGLFATGRLSTEMECTCVGCLERFRLAVSVNDFAIQVELTGREEIDLTEPIREDILLALPAHPRCDWNGERTCPGIHRQAPPPVSEAEDSSRDVWSALNQLKIK